MIENSYIYIYTHGCDRAFKNIYITCYIKLVENKLRGNSLVSLKTLWFYQKALLHKILGCNNAYNSNFKHCPVTLRNFELPRALRDKRRLIVYPLFWLHYITLIATYLKELREQTKKDLEIFGADRTFIK